MANKKSAGAKPYTVPIELNGEKMNLCYDFNAWEKLEEMLGVESMVEALLSLSRMKTMSAKSMKSWLWCGLIHEKPELTLKEVGSWLGFDSTQYVVEKISEAVTGDMPKPTDDQIAKAKAVLEKDGDPEGFFNGQS